MGRLLHAVVINSQKAAKTATPKNRFRRNRFSERVAAWKLTGPKHPFVHHSAFCRSQGNAFILWLKMHTMADAKMRALVGIGRLAVAVAAGGAIWWMWKENRPFDEWYVSIGAAAVVVIFAFLLLSKLKGGGD